MYTSLIKAFETALGVHSPWTIDNTELIPNENRLGSLEMHVYVSFPRGAEFTCPICGEEHTSYDTRECVRRHLNFFQYRCCIHAEVPGIECSQHGVRTVDVPLEREGSGFTLMTEGVILTFIKHMAVATAAREIGEHDTKLWRVLNYYVDDCIGKRKLEDVEAVGVNEYRHKEQNCITVFLSHAREKNPKARVTDIEDGTGNDTITAFSEAFSRYKGKKDAVTGIAGDMCHGYRKSMQKQFPGATLTVDKFHVAKMAGEAVDDVRKRESRSRDKRRSSILKGTRYLWQTNRDNLKGSQAPKLDELLSSEENPDTSIAYQYKLRLQELYDKSRDFDEALYYFGNPVLEMADSKVYITAKVAKSITGNAVEILNCFISRKTNAILEGFNSRISLIKSRAGGFRNMENFKNMICFSMGGFDFPFIKIMA